MVAVVFLSAGINYFNNDYSMFRQGGKISDQQIPTNIFLIDKDIFHVR